MGSNKYSNIFVSKSCYERISEYICIQQVDTNEYRNIFISKKLTRMNIRIYSYPKNDTNKYPNEYSDQKYSNIWIFEYIRHTLPQFQPDKSLKYVLLKSKIGFSEEILRLCVLLKVIPLNAYVIFDNFLLAQCCRMFTLYLIISKYVWRAKLILSSLTLVL